MCGLFSIRGENGVMNERRICLGGVPKDDNGVYWPLGDASVI